MRSLLGKTGHVLKGRGFDESVVTTVVTDY